MREYPLKCEFHIYLGFQQSKHEDSSQSGKDPYQWKDNILKNIVESGFLNLELVKKKVEF
jgi:hypothetical protein